MKIEKIELPGELTGTYELASIEMNKLGRVVLLAGKNGSGKSRFLSLLKENL